MYENYNVLLRIIFFSSTKIDFLFSTFSSVRSSISRKDGKLYNIAKNINIARYLFRLFFPRNILFLFLYLPYAISVEK